MNKKILVLTYALITVISIICFVFVMNVGKVFPNLAKISIFTKFVSEPESIGLFQKIIIFISIFSIILTIYYILKSIFRILEKDDNSVPVLAKFEEFDEGYGFRYVWNYNNKEYSMSDLSIYKVFHDEPKEIQLYINPKYPFEWGYKNNESIDKYNNKHSLFKNIKLLIALIICFFLIFIVF